MADDGFNGSTLNFAAVNLGEIRSISFTEDGNPVDVTSLDDAFHKFLNGLVDMECTVGVIGGADKSLGETGALTVTWNDGTTSGAGETFQISARDTSGDLDGEIATNYTFKPYGG